MKKLILAFSIILTSNSLSAGIIQTFTDRSLFELALESFVTEDFNSVTSDIDLASGPFILPSLTASTTGAAAEAVIDAPPFISGFNIDGTTDLRLLLEGGSTVVFDLGGSYNAFGADFQAWNGSSSPMFVGNDEFIFSNTGFFGVITDIAFSSFVLAPTTLEDGEMDNIVFGSTSIPVPVPSTLAIFVLGIACLMSRTLRK